MIEDPKLIARHAIQLSGKIAARFEPEAPREAQFGTLLSRGL